MTECAVAVVGAGPTGMMLAAELTLANVEVVLIERRPNSDLESPRSRGLHARTIAVLDQRGVAERFLSAGTIAQVQAFAGIALNISDFPTRHNYGLALLQSQFEHIMAGWLTELNVPIVRERSVTSFIQHNDFVDVALSDDSTIRARFLVGCDGAHSVIRKGAGIDFAGWDPTTCWIHAEAYMSDRPVFGLRGGGGIGPGEDDRVGVTLIESALNHASEPTLDDLRAALVRVDGTDYGVHSPRYISRFTDMTRQAVSYRDRRVFLAGDAAHIHPPLGGQGLNLGVQDAVNLGWKLAQAVKGIASPTLLDSYETERHPVAARVLRNTMAQRALGATDERTLALRETVAQLCAMDEPRKHLAGMISGLDVHYEHDPERASDVHPAVGWPMPDLDLTTSEGARRVAELLHDATGLLLTFDSDCVFEIDEWRDRVRLVAASPTGPWELPILGTVTAPVAVLVRPDGHIAWAQTTANRVGAKNDTGLERALSTWFGSPLS